MTPVKLGASVLWRTHRWVCVSVAREWACKYIQTQWTADERVALPVLLFYIKVLSVFIVCYDLHTVMAHRNQNKGQAHHLSYNNQSSYHLHTEQIP